MRITVSDAEDLPANAYISIRVGETRRQKRFTPGDHFDFPSAQRYVSLDVFEKIGSKHVSLSELQSLANGSAGACNESAEFASPAASGARCIEVMRASGAPMRLHVKAVTTEAIVVPTRTSRHMAALQANRYLDRHALQKVLQSMVQILIKTQPDDPVGFMTDYLQDCKSSIQPDRDMRADSSPSRDAQTSQSEELQHPAPSRTPPGRPPGAPPKGGRPGRPPGRPPANGPPGAKAKSAAVARPIPKVGSGASLADQLAQQKDKLRSFAPPPKEDPEATLAAEAEAAARAAEAAAETTKLHALAEHMPLGAVAAREVLADCATPSGGSGASVLGRGRFASVKLAKVQRAGSAGEIVVAAKRFSSSSASALRAARREADALLKIGLHPNIVQLLGVVLPPDNPVAAARRENEEDNRQSPSDNISLQLLLRPAQGSLYNLLAREPEWEALARGGRLDLLVDVGRGLCAMHGASFAHLDIKSHNVLVDQRADGCWTARICDLGSAYEVGPDALPPPPEGTSGWTAPEILEMHPAAKTWADPRLADVFSFGVVIWEVVSGPDIDHPLCGLAGDAYCEALAEGRRPPFPSGMEKSEEAALAAECWKLEAQCRPSLFQATDRLVHCRQVLKREAI